MIDKRFFQEHGYLIKRGLLSSERMALTLDRMWEHAPPGFMRESPETWTVIPEKKALVSDKTVYGGNIWRPYISGAPFLSELLVESPDVKSIAMQLIGKIESSVVRGIHCVIPDKEKSIERRAVHVDAMPLALGVVGYLNRVVADGGAFTIFPGSHKTFRDVEDGLDTRTSDNPDLNALSWDDAFFFTGAAGDVIFWDTHLAHTFNFNVQDTLRIAVFGDYK